MIRNWYAAILLAIMGFALCWAGQYMNSTTQQLEQNLQTAYSMAENQNYSESRQAFLFAADQCRSYSQIWYLLIRRSLIDQLNQTLATIPSYVAEENLADLAVETARACEQTSQIRQSFFSWF